MKNSKNCMNFSGKITEQTLQNTHDFLFQPRAIGSQILPLVHLFNQINVVMFPLIRDERLAGNELFKILGSDFFQGKKISCNTPIQSLTIRYYLHPFVQTALRINCMTVIYALFVMQYGTEAISNPLTPPNSDFSFFTAHTVVSGRLQRIHFVFAAQFKPEYVTTLDAIQLRLSSPPQLVDNNQGNQFIHDMVNGIVRIPDEVRGKSAQQSKILFRALRDGKTVASDEYKIFESEELYENASEESLFLFWQAVTKDLSHDDTRSLISLFQIYNATCKFGKSGLARLFFSYTSRRRRLTFKENDPWLQTLFSEAVKAAKGAFSLYPKQTNCKALADCLLCLIDHIDDHYIQSHMSDILPLVFDPMAIHHYPDFMITTLEVLIKNSYDLSEEERGRLGTSALYSLFEMRLKNVPHALVLLCDVYKAYYNETLPITMQKQLNWAHHELSRISL